MTPGTVALRFSKGSWSAACPAQACRRLVDYLRRACAKAGVLEGYDHTCRRCKARATRAKEGAPTTFTWRHPDAEQHRCPFCRMKLWVKPIPAR